MELAMKDMVAELVRDEAPRPGTTRHDVAMEVAYAERYRTAVRDQLRGMIYHMVTVDSAIQALDKAEGGASSSDHMHFRKEMTDLFNAASRLCGRIAAFGGIELLGPSIYDDKLFGQIGEARQRRDDTGWIPQP
jgi:hypothetical protein